MNSVLPTVFAYDTFVWRDWMTPLAEKYGVTGYSDGESFLPRFLAETERWKNVIEARPGDVASLHWDSRPISILVIDEKAHQIAAAEVMRLLHAKRGKDAAAMAEHHRDNGAGAGKWIS